MACSIAGAEVLQKMWEGHYWEGVWLFLNPWAVVRLRTSSSYWTDPGKCGSHSELFFFFFRKEWDPFTPAVIVAVKKRSDTGSLRSPHNQFVSAVLQRTVGAARQAAMERSGGKEKRERWDERQRQRVAQEERPKGACKMMTTKATFAGPRPAKG